MAEPTHRVLFFGNGNTAVFDADGKQLPELQEPWLVMFAEFLASKGIDPLRCEVMLPNGRLAYFWRAGTGILNWRVGDKE